MPAKNPLSINFNLLARLAGFAGLTATSPLSSSPLAGLTHIETLQLPLNLLLVTSLLLLSLLAAGLDDLKNSAEGILPRIQALGNNLPLLLTKRPDVRAVDEEALVELGELALDETSADDVNDPKFDFLFRDVEAAGDSVVGEGAVFARGGERCKGKEADLAVSGVSVDAYNIISFKFMTSKLRKQTVVLSPGVVLVVKLDVVLQLTSGEDLKELEELRLRLLESGDTRGDGELVKV